MFNLFIEFWERPAICDCVSCCQEEDHQSLQAYIDYMNGRCRLRAMSHGLGQRACSLCVRESCHQSPWNRMKQIMYGIIRIPKRAGLMAFDHPDPYDSPAGDCQGVDSKNYLLESSSEPKDPVADFASFVVSRCVKCQLTFKTCGASWGLWIPTQIGIWKILATVLADLLNPLESIESSDFADFVCLELPTYSLGSNNPGVLS